ncbi:MAG: protein kinase domain-containing protein [Myxococcales bacterium]
MDASEQGARPADPHGLSGAVLDGRYRVDAYLSGGGMGDVYRAEQVSLGRRVALKVLREDMTRSPDMAARFTHEAQALSRLDHPNIVRVIDFAQTDARAYLVMELVEGETLEALLQREGALDPRRAVTILAALCDALGAAHDAGIVHRDLKPENVVLTGPGRDVPKILDFGIARFTFAAGTTQQGLVIGTPEYMSPEQALGKEVDHRSDLYSLSVMAYRLLCGGLPFKASDPRALLMMHVSQPPPALLTQSSRLAAYEALGAVVMRGLAKTPEERFETAAALKQALLGALEAAPPAASGTQQMFAAAPAPATARLNRTTSQGGTTQLRASVARTQNVAVMFTAIEGFEERTSRQSPAQQAELLAHYDALLAPVLKGFGGRKIKSVGDGLLVTFPSPTQAVLCGAALQDRLWHFNAAAAPEQRFQIRIAANLGEVRVEDGDVFGEPVNIAARTREVAEPGQVVFTDAVYLAMTRSEIAAEELGPRQFKGIPHAVRLYRVKPASDAGPPFAGVALKRLGRLPNPLAAQRRRERLLRARRRLDDAAAFLRRHPRASAGSAAAAVAVLLAIALAVPRLSGPVARAERLLEQKQPKAALVELANALESAPAGASPKALAPLKALQGRAQFATGEYDACYASFKEAAELDPATLREPELRVMVDLLDLDRFKKREELVELLATRVGRRAEEPVRGLVFSKRPRTRNDALEVLEKIGRARDADRFAVVSADLAEKKVDCGYRKLAAKRLEMIGDEASVKLLQQLASERGCGQPEAQEALRRMNRSSGEQGGAP